jgi:hypothetical protein
MQSLRRNVRDNIPIVRAHVDDDLYLPLLAVDTTRPMTYNLDKSQQYRGLYQIGQR